MNGTLLETQALTKEYGDRPVLRAIDLHLQAGEIVALMGANGSGKTTLLGCLAAIVRPTCGTVLWLGTRAAAEPAQRRSIGMLAHESRLYPSLTLLENLVFAARMYGLDRPAQRAMQGLAEAGLRSHCNRLPSQVSRGMRQRAAMARALIHEPAILLLDEPFSGLDAEGCDWLARVLSRLRSDGRAICLATHDRSRAMGLADRIWELTEGRLNPVRTARLADYLARDAA